MRLHQTFVIFSVYNTFLITLWITFGEFVQPVRANIGTPDDPRCSILEPRQNFKIPTCTASLSSNSIGCTQSSSVVIISLISRIRRSFVKSCLKYLKKLCHKSYCRLQLQNSACNRLEPFKTEISIEYACVKAIPPGEPLIEGFDPSHPLFENDRLLVSCSWSGGIPAAPVRLSCGTTISIGVSNTLLAIDVKRDLNQKLCICEGLHPGLSKNVSQTMTVYYPPAIPKVYQSSEFPWAENSTEHLICRSDPEGNPPPTSYVWVSVHEDREQDIQSDGEGQLTFNHISRDSSGLEYYCMASNQYTQMTEMMRKSRNLTIRVTYPPSGHPKMQVKGQNESLYGNETLAVACRWRGGNPEANLRLTCGSMTYMGVSEAAVLLEFAKHLNVTSCTCEGIHPLKHIVHTRNVSFNYIPQGEILIEGFETNEPQIENNTLIVACSWVGSYPPPRVQLWCGGVNSSGVPACAHSFFLSRQWHGTNCICTGKFQAWKKTVTKRLTINYTPGNPTITSQSNLPWIAGDQQMLTCKAEPGNPPDTQYKWLSESGYLIHKGDTLVFDPVTHMDHKRKIICQAENSLSLKIAGHPKITSVRLEVKFPPGKPMISSSSDFPWLEGTDQALYCEAKPGNPPHVFYKWHVANSGPIHSGYMLRFNPVTRYNHSERLVCRAENSFTIMQHSKHVTSSVTVLVEYRPTITLSPNTTVIESSDVVLKCSADGNPTPNVFFEFEGQRLNSTDITSIETRLQLRNISRTQAGRYKCTANAKSYVHQTLSSHKFMNIVVYYPPSVQVFTQNATDGDQVNLTCVADGQPQTYTYKWQHLWGEMVIREFPESEYIPGHSVLTLDNITYEDSGTYRCLADNGIPDRLGDKTQSGVGDFLVKAKPVFETNTVTNVSTEYGGNVTISVSFYSYPPYTSVSWVFDDSMTSEPETVTEVDSAMVGLSINGLDVIADGHCATITLTDFKETDARTISLIVNNSVGLSSSQITIIPAGPPLEPLDFTVVNITHTTITVKWTPSFNGGYEQLFYLSHRPINQDEQWTETIYADPGNDNDIFVTIGNLKRGAQYAFTLHTENSRPSERNHSQTLKLMTKTEEIQTVRISPSTFGMGSALGFVIGGMMAAALVIAGCFLVGRNSNNGSERNDTKTSTTTTPPQCQTFELASVTNATTMTTTDTKAGASGCEQSGATDTRLTPVSTENRSADAGLPNSRLRQNLNEDEL